MNLRRGDVVTVKMVVGCLAAEPDQFYVHPHGDQYSTSLVHKDRILGVDYDHQPGDVVVDVSDKSLIYTVLFVKDDEIVMENRNGHLKLGTKRHYRRYQQESAECQLSTS